MRKEREREKIHHRPLTMSVASVRLDCALICRFIVAVNYFDRSTGSKIKLENVNIFQNFHYVFVQSIIRAWACDCILWMRWHMIPSSTAVALLGRVLCVCMCVIR